MKQYPHWACRVAVFLNSLAPFEAVGWVEEDQRLVYLVDLRLVDRIQEDLEDCLLAVVYAFDVFPRVPFGFCIFFPLANGSTPTVNKETNIVGIGIYLGIMCNFKINVFQHHKIKNCNI